MTRSLYAKLYGALQALWEAENLRAWELRDQSYKAHPNAAVMFYTAAEQHRVEAIQIKQFADSIPLPIGDIP